MSRPKKNSDPHAIVVGSGFGGLASALRLKAKGYQVTVLERLAAAGGRAQVFEKGGFRHDAGPTVITAPFLFDELFELFGESRENHVEFTPVEPWYRFHFEDGDEFDYGEDLTRLKQEIARFSPEDSERYEELISASKKIFDVGFTKLSDKPFLNLSDMVRQIPQLLKLRADRSVWNFVGKFLKHPKIRRAFSIHPLLVGGNPFTTSSIYALIHYLEREWGVHFTMGGTGKLVDELVRLGERNQIDFRYGTDVEKLITEGQRATGVQLAGGEVLKADLVVANCDPPVFYKEIMPSHFKAPLRLQHDSLVQYSMGLYVLYFGTRRKYEDVAHHTIWMGERFKGLLAEIFAEDKLPPDFSLYVHRPTATDPSFAPEGCDSFYVLCPVPNLRAKNVDWSVEGKNLRDRIVASLSDTLLPDLESTIVEDFWMTPKEFKKDYRSAHGAGFSIAPVLSQSASFRYPNRDAHVENLFFVGAGTHPGAGLPGVVSSAKVVDSMIPSVAKKIHV